MSNASSHDPGPAGVPGLRRLSVGIFLLSFGALVVEITLTRIFSYAISYHFAYLTIATALLGFGSAGSILAARPELLGGPRRRLVVSSALAGTATVAALAFSSVVRFHPGNVGSDPVAIATLAAYYLVVTVPFLFTGLAIVTILASRPRRVGRLYGLDLAGAGLGCAVSVPLIWTLETPMAVVVGALVLAAAAACFVERDRTASAVALAGVAATAVLGGLTLFYGPFPPSPGKFLSTFLSSPGARHLYTQWTPLSRVDAVGWEASEDSWKTSYAVSGVSPYFRGRGPELRMIGYDGGSFAVMYAYDGDPASLEVFRHHMMAAPYVLLDEPRTLIIGLGGGADALAGIANGAGPMTGLELNPVTAWLGTSEFRDFDGGLFDSPELDVVAAEARHWVEASPEKFDLIVLNSADTLSALSSGAYVLAESYLYTVEAFEGYLRHLEPGGLYALYSFDNFGVAGPTIITLRFAETFSRALENLGVADPKSHVVVIAGRGPVPLVATLVKREPFTADEVERLERFVDRQGFSFWHRPDREVDHQVGAFLWKDATERRHFLADHYLRVDAATDASPFFFNFYKWRRILVPSDEDAGTTPATGQRMLVVMAVEAALVAVVMILLPLVCSSTGGRVRRPLAFIGYFSALGLGFIVLEISLLQRFVLFLGYPTYSLSVVLFCLLTATGAGSLVSTRLQWPLHPKVTWASLAVAVMAGALLLFAPAVFAACLHLPLVVRIGVSVVLLAPLGLVLGLFFPLGVRVVERIDPRLVPWAWAVNGCTTVVGTVTAVMLAMAYGFDVVTALAVLLYLGGAFALRRLAGVR